MRSPRTGRVLSTGASWLSDATRLDELSAGLGRVAFDDGGWIRVGGELDDAAASIDNLAAAADDMADATRLDGLADDVGRLGGEQAVPEGWRPLSSSGIDQLPLVRDGSHLNADGTLPANTWYRAGEHDYFYHTDANVHIDLFYAEDLQLKTHDGRLRHDPDTLGKLPGDHAGHLAADRFGGSPKLDNLVSQLSDINFRRYKALENEWAAAMKSDPPGTFSVDVRITSDATGRPTSFTVESVVNGRAREQVFRQ